MSYHIYTTEGLILKKKSVRESDTLLYVLTKDYGLILASARSSRLLKSKLRQFLQEYSLVRLSCIKSKNGWKITNADNVTTSFYNYPISSRPVLANISAVLLKMITGETPQKEIFEIVRDGFASLANYQNESEMRSIEILTVFRLMNKLGYVPYHSELSRFADNSDWRKELFKEAEQERTYLISTINKAIKESHL